MHWADKSVDETVVSMAFLLDVPKAVKKAVMTEMLAVAEKAEAKVGMKVYWRAVHLVDIPAAMMGSVLVETMAVPSVASKA